MKRRPQEPTRNAYVLAPKMSDDMASVVVVETSGGDDAANGAGEDDAASMVGVETSGDAANGAGEGDAADEAFADALAAAIDAAPYTPCAKRGRLCLMAGLSAEGPIRHV